MSPLTCALLAAWCKVKKWELEREIQIFVLAYDSRSEATDIGREVGKNARENSPLWRPCSGVRFFCLPAYFGSMCKHSLKYQHWRHFKRHNMSHLLAEKTMTSVKRKETSLNRRKKTEKGNQVFIDFRLLSILFLFVLQCTIKILKSPISHSAQPLRKPVTLHCNT